MPTLRKCLKRPEPYLFVLAAVVLAGCADSFRNPDRQVLARLYVAVVRDVYQPYVRPLQEGRVRCRYIPSCSDYSIEAVQRFGIRAGLLLSWRRVMSCKQTVPLGTRDAVPSAATPSTSAPRPPSTG